jgi:hypothetical protein
MKVRRCTVFSKCNLYDLVYLTVPGVHLLHTQIYFLPKFINSAKSRLQRVTNAINKTNKHMYRHTNYSYSYFVMYILHKTDLYKSYTYPYFMLPNNFHMMWFSDFISISCTVGLTVTETDRSK